MGVSIYSIKTRFIFSLFANILRGAAGFFANILIARYLLPGNYGVLAFLLTSFQALMQLFDQGVTSAFYTFISKKAPKPAVYSVYLTWIIGQFALVMIFVSVLLPDKLLNALWNHSSRGLVLWAFVAIFSQQVIWTSITQLGEAKRRTLIAQGANIIVAMIYLTLIFVTHLIGTLSPMVVLKTMSGVYLSASALMVFVFLNYRDIGKGLRFNYHQFKLCMSDYYIYCKPLMLMAAVSFFYTFLTNWMLNNFGGAVQQGYYQIAYRFSAIALLATTSILRIFWKEMAVLDEENDSKRAQELFYKVLKIVFFFGSIIAGFMLPWSKEIILILLGKSYLGGSLVFSIMLLYPIHQTMGQVLGATYQSKSMTKSYARVSIAPMLLAIVTTYFLLAPSTSEIPGLSLGGLGMSLNMVAIQFFSVSLSLYVICKMNSWKLKWGFQFIVLGVMLLLGYLAKSLVEDLIFRGANLITTQAMIMHIALAFFVYISLVLCFMLSKTEFILGIERKTLLAMIPFAKLIR